MLDRSISFIENDKEFQFDELFDSNLFGTELISFNDVNSNENLKDQKNQNKQLQNDYILFPSSDNKNVIQMSNLPALPLPTVSQSSSTYSTRTTPFVYQIQEDYLSQVDSFNSLLESPLDLNESFNSPFDEFLTTPLFSPIGNLEELELNLFSPSIPFEFSVDPLEVQQAQIEEVEEKVIIKEEEIVEQVPIQVIKEEEEWNGISTRGATKRKATSLGTNGERDPISGRRLFNGTRSTEFQRVDYDMPTQKRKYTTSSSTSKKAIPKIVQKKLTAQIKKKQKKRSNSSDSDYQTENSLSPTSSSSSSSSTSPPSHPLTQSSEPTPEELAAANRRKNTLAARVSRKRKEEERVRLLKENFEMRELSVEFKEVLRGKDEEIEGLKGEVRELKGEVRELKEMFGILD